MTWSPNDAELDAVARTLDAHEPARDRAEQNRTALLAAAATRAQMSRRSRVPYVAAGLAFAAAAAAAIWVGTRPDHGAPAVAVPSAKQVITPIGAARFERVTDWADFVVRLDDGKIAVQVAGLDAADRFRVKTADAEAETRGAKFDVSADQGRIASLDVREGRVELRRIDQQVIVLSAGQSWAASVKTVERDVIAPATPPVVASNDVAAEPSAQKHVETRPEPSAPKHGDALPQPSAQKRVEPRPEPAQHADARPEPPRLDTPAPAAPAVAAPRPGEAEFRAGTAALRAGDASTAARSFASSCTLAKREALGDDACFWSGAAAKRAGDTATARAALTAFLHDFPTSARAPEAAALLGWIDYDAGQLDAAEKLFHQAEHDRVPQVRDSAQRGLTAIDRKRRAP